jgi:hypothetical protein
MKQEQSRKKKESKIMPPMKPKSAYISKYFTVLPAHNPGQYFAEVGEPFG